MKKLLCLACLLFLSACLSSTEPALSDPSSQSVSVYTSQFTDVPIPMEMQSEPSNALITINADGHKVGTEVFSGSTEQNTLANLMIQNLYSQNWKLVSLIHGRMTLQLYTKDSRYLILLIKGESSGSHMELWVLNQLTNPENNPALQHFLQNTNNDGYIPPSQNTPDKPDPDFDTSPAPIDDFTPFPDEAFESDLTSDDGQNVNTIIEDAADSVDESITNALNAIGLGETLEPIENGNSQDFFEQEDLYIDN